MPFKSGPDNPSVQRGEYLKRKREEEKTRKSERYKAQVQREVDLGVRIVPGFTPAKSVYAPRNQKGIKKGPALAKQVLALHARGGGTQLEVAYKTGCSQSTVSRILSGKHRGRTGKPRGRPPVTTLAERELVRTIARADPSGRYKDWAAKFKEISRRKLTEKQVAAVLAYRGDPEEE